MRVTSGLFRSANPNCGCWRGNQGRLIDRTGRRYGKLVVIRRAEDEPRAGVWWLCMCDCGNEYVAGSSALGSGHTNSCGHLRGNRLPAGEAAANKVLAGYKHAAKARGLTWDLAVEDFRRLIAMDCFYCGAPPASKMKSVIHDKEWTYNGLDRIDSSKNYTLPNVLPCCPTCNHAKKDMPFDTFLEWVARLTQFQFLNPGMMPSAMLKAAGQKPALHVVQDAETA